MALGRLRNRMCHVPQQWRGHAHRQLDALLRLRDRRLHTSPTASNETAMMSEILARGPISCSLYDKIKDFECYDGTYTIDAPPTDANTTRVVSIVGWGESKKEGGRYWIARHSEETHWDDQGFFRIRRGKNTLRIKGFCFRG